LDGEVLVHFDVDDVHDYEDLDSVMVDTRSGLVPYFIEFIQIRDAKHVVVRFEDTDYKQAGALVRRDLYLPLNNLPKLEGNKFYNHEVIGFLIKDLNFGEVGILVKVLDYPHQDVFSVMHGEKEVLIPVSDEIIKEVRRMEKEIWVECPEGLIELYL